MVSDRIPPCVVAIMIALASFGPMCHNSDSEAAYRSVCLFCETKMCRAGKRSLSYSAIFILEIHNSFSWTINRYISVNMAS